MIQRNADGPLADENEPQGSGETLAEAPAAGDAGEAPDDERGVLAAAEAPADGPLASRLASDEGETLGSDDLPPSDDGGQADDGNDEPSAPPCDRPLGQRLEAVLFAAGQPLAPVKLARVLGVPIDDVKAALDDLVTAWQGREGAIDLVAIAGGYRFMTRAAFQADLQGLARKGKTERLSPAALETLSIVAYKQPITRADIEAVRGVAAGPLLRVLLDRDLIRVSGRSPEPGHPLLYGTTKRFLDHFGLESLKQLPDIRDLLDVS